MDYFTLRYAVIFESALKDMTISGVFNSVENIRVEIKYDRFCIQLRIQRREPKIFCWLKIKSSYVCLYICIYICLYICLYIFYHNQLWVFRFLFDLVYYGANQHFLF